MESVEAKTIFAMYKFELFSGQEEQIDHSDLKQEGTERVNYFSMEA